jgi:uncharacterized 2Fe-2S/4Fe-4S cluster protein (DUF4445 family)
MADVSVRFEPVGATVSVPEGSTIHEAAAEAGVVIAAPCGGLGRCGSCRVRVSGDVREPGPSEHDALGSAVSRGVRLACLARVDGPSEVVVERIGGAGALRIVTDGPEVPADVEPPEARGIVCPPGVRPIGAAVDIGTTTLVVRLHDLRDGAPLGESASLNPQMAYGHDVLTRVSQALGGEARRLREEVTREIEVLVTGLTDRPSLSQSSLCEVVVVGNPTMTHLFLGRDVTPLAVSPNTGALIDAVETDAASADLPLLGDARVTVGPAVSAFVGADAVAALLATGIADREDPTLLIDLGTNGEVVLAAGGVLLATSAAAGPAFEGAGITSGMRAESGAIERVWLDDAYGMSYMTIDDEPAAGLCGSGLLDAVAALLAAGALDATGRLQPTGALADRVYDTDDGRHVQIAPGVSLTQNDIRQLQLGKAAVQVTLEVLVAEAGLEPDDVREVVVAGGFGTHLRPASLAALGVIPHDWATRVTFGGNAALTGASMMLLSRDARRRATELARSARTVPLAERADFQPRFLGALDFPVT